MYTVKQIDDIQVIQAIVDNKKVLRINVATNATTDLATKSIDVIRKGFDNADFIYVIVEVIDNDRVE